MISSEWIKDAAILAVKTIAQTMLSMVTVGQAVMDVNWRNVVSVSLVAGFISILTSIVGLPEIDNDFSGIPEREDNK